jgi:hypothetical protein
LPDASLIARATAGHTSLSHPASAIDIHDQNPSVNSPADGLLHAARSSGLVLDNKFHVGFVVRSAQRFENSGLTKRSLRWRHSIKASVPQPLRFGRYISLRRRAASIRF